MIRVGIAAAVLITAAASAYAQEVSICDYPTDGYGELAEQALSVHDMYTGWVHDDDDAVWARMESIMAVAERFWEMRWQRRDAMAPPMAEWVRDTELAVRMYAYTMYVKWIMRYTDDAINERVDDLMEISISLVLAFESLVEIGETAKRALDEWQRMAAEAGC